MKERNVVSAAVGLITIATLCALCNGEQRSLDQIDALRTKVAEITPTVEIDALETKVAKVAPTIETLKTKVADFDVGLATLEAKIRDLETKIRKPTSTPTFR